MRLIKKEKEKEIYISDVTPNHIILCYNYGWYIVTSCEFRSDLYNTIYLEKDFTKNNCGLRSVDLNTILNHYSEIEVFNTMQEAIAFLNEKFEKELEY